MNEFGEISGAKYETGFVGAINALHFQFEDKIPLSGVMDRLETHTS
jgi:hypothetical protein